MPKIIIIAGPNGAGKTTFAREFLPNEAACPIFVNADLIAAGLSPFSPDTATVRAARIMLEQIVEHVRRKESFAFETTLSGVGYARRIPEWQALGYRVELFFLSLPEPKDAISRVALRVRQGGHDVPEAVIRRRFASGLGTSNESTVTWSMPGRCTTIQATNQSSLIGENAMNPKPIEQAKTSDLAKSLPALRRAAKHARELARKTAAEEQQARKHTPTKKTS